SYAYNFNHNPRWDLSPRTNNHYSLDHELHVAIGFGKASARSNNKFGFERDRTLPRTIGSYVSTCFISLMRSTANGKKHIVLNYLVFR
ncbi:hypothetical protein, partial [Tautonia rosea]|uniref:hypothetical protein n=1 Tax=Tautonia rosea TaxID=2728037 RepID=UPI0019D248DB